MGYPQLMHWTPVRFTDLNHTLEMFRSWDFALFGRLALPCAETWFT